MKSIHWDQKDCKVGCWRGMGIHLLPEENVIVDSNMQLVVCERDESVRHIVFKTQSVIKLTYPWHSKQEDTDHHQIDLIGGETFPDDQE